MHAPSNGELIAHQGEHRSARIHRLDDVSAAKGSSKLDVAGSGNSDQANDQQMDRDDVVEPPGMARIGMPVIGESLGRETEIDFHESSCVIQRFFDRAENARVPAPPPRSRQPASGGNDTLRNCSAFAEIGLAWRTIAVVVQLSRSRLGDGCLHGRQCGADCVRPRTEHGAGRCVCRIRHRRSAPASLPSRARGRAEEKVLAAAEACCRRREGARCEAARPRPYMRCQTDVAAQVQYQWGGRQCRPDAGASAPAAKLPVVFRAPATNDTDEEVFVLYAIAVVLSILWRLGLITSTIMGGFIHVLLVIAAVAALLQVVSGRRVP